MPQKGPPAVSCIDIKLPPAQCRRQTRSRLFNGNLAARSQLFRIMLRNQNSQNAVLVFRLDVLRLYIADLETTGASARITLLTKDTALLVLFVLVKALFGADGQITVLDIHVDLVLFKAGQIHCETVTLGVIRLADIGLHQVSAVLTEQRIMTAEETGAKEIV